MKYLHSSVIFLAILIVIINAHAATSLVQSDIITAQNQSKIANSADPPTIDWFGPPENSTSSYVLMWDGAYTGQTEEVWNFDIWVNDTDSVDTVIFRFYWQREWLNRSTVLIDGNETRGCYEGNLTYGVVWDWANGRPNPSGGSFQFKVFANDTLGNWIETTTATYSGGYMIVHPPVLYILFGTPLSIGVISGCAGIIAIVVTIIRRRGSQ